MAAIIAGRPEAAAVVWDWRSEAEPEGRNGLSPRIVGTLQALAIAAVGGVLFYFGFFAAYVVFTVAGVVLFSALVSPEGLYAGVRRFFHWLGMITGRVISLVFLVPLFYGFFYPFGLLMRRGRRDRLQRFFDADSPSYWKPHVSVEGAAPSQERQF